MQNLRNIEMSQIIKSPLDENLDQKYYSQFAPWRGSILFYTGFFLFYLFVFVETTLSVKLPTFFFFLGCLVGFLGCLDIGRNMLRYTFGKKEINEKRYTVLPWKGKKLFYATILLYVAFLLSNLFSSSVNYFLFVITIVLSFISLFWYYVYAINILKLKNKKQHNKEAQWMR